MYGMCLLLLVKSFIKSLNTERLLLMLCASLRLELVAPLLDILSLPAKSTNINFPRVLRPVLLFTICVTILVTKWILLESKFV